MDIITDLSKLEDWSTEIDPRKEGKESQKIILALKDTMRENNLEYLTAPQIGFNRRIFCIKFGNEYRSFLNPMVENNSNFFMTRETCASIPGKTFIMPRFSKINFYFTTPLGKVESAVLVGRAAVVFQHCIDHLNGMNITDLGLEIDEDFDNATDEEREEIIRMYAEALDVRQKKLEEDIVQDEDLKKTSDAIDFMNKVKSGDVVLDNSENPVENKEKKDE